MSIWVNVFCRASVSSLRPEELVRGIERRLAVMTYLVVPDEEELPAEVAKRLEIDSVSAQGSWSHLTIHYRQDGARPLLVERWSDPDSVAAEVGEFLNKLEPYRQEEAARVREHLRPAMETVGIELKASDARSMGWPVALAAAAEIAALGDGIIHADGLGWVGPGEREIDMIMSE